MQEESEVAWEIIRTKAD